MTPSLVPIPWQPTYFLAPSTLALLEKANEYAGHEITVVDAWRSWAAQNVFWVARQNYLYHGGPYAPPASNPDTGLRQHPRGAAVDIGYPTAQNRAAMLKAGFTPDADENWHFNNPNWADMPIIPTNTYVAGGGSKPLPSVKDTDVALFFTNYSDRVARDIAPTGVTSLKAKSGSDLDLSGGHGGPKRLATVNVHVVATGLKPGDSLGLRLYRDASPHYVDGLIADGRGEIDGNATFSLPVGKGQKLYARLSGRATNSAPWAHLLMFDADVEFKAIA